MILILWVISLSLRVTSSGVSTLQKVNNKVIELNNKEGKGLDVENITKIKKLNKAVGNATKKVISSIRMVVDIIKNILCFILPAVMLIDIIAFVLIITVSSSCLLLFSEGGYISSSGNYLVSSSQGNQSSSNSNSNSSSNSDTPVGSATGINIIKEAEKYVGNLPYVWGGVSLETGADCSGFICAIYEKFGYNLWGSRVDLVTVGTAINSIDDAQAGDILVYSGHVALYDGNGGRIHAPQTGEMVSHDTNLGNYIAIRRVIDK